MIGGITLFITNRNLVFSLGLEICGFQEERNKIPIPKSAELLLTSTTIQWQAVVRIEDYRLKGV
jgi:hypothetical protein